MTTGSRRPRTVDEFRARFQAGPVGRWAASEGAGPGAREVWLFRANGTGLRVQDGAEPNQTEFTWRARGDFAIAIDLGDGVRELAFEFSEVRLDAVREVVLHQAGRPGFASSPSPLSYLGPPR